MTFRILFAALSVFSLTSFVFSASAQSGEVYGPGPSIERVRELFAEDMYEAAAAEIDLLRSEYPDMDGLLRSEIEVYALFCNIFLGRPNVDALVLEFEDKYHYAPELALARFFYARHYFDKQDYVKALTVFDSLENSLLPRDAALEYVFDKAYCCMRVGRTGDARAGFSEITAMEHNPYTVQSTYYLAYINYTDKDFGKALELFCTISNDDRYGPSSRYYMLESKLMLKDYAYVVENGASVAGAVSQDMRPKVARMVSEAYYALGEPEQAKKWFESYSSSGAGLTRKDNYYFGVISYSLEAYYAAADAFSKVAGEKDSLAQSAFYYMGNSYLRLKNKVAAMEAFKNASLMDFDDGTRRDALFQYAKLSFDLNSDITPFMAFLEAYPDAEESDEIHSYMATAYLIRKDYKEALAALGGIKYPTPEMTLNLQKAAFFRGMQLMGIHSYNDAAEMFALSVENGGYNGPLELLARFWMAEACYRSGRTDKAMEINASLILNPRFRTTREYSTALFNQGYCYFDNQDYVEARKYFSQFLDLHYSDMDMILEARLRLADTYFMMRDYASAAKIYEEVSIMNYRSSAIVYAAYYGALSYGLMSDYGKKIKALEGILDERGDTLLYSKAVYELGRTYVQTGEISKAEKCFNYMINEVGDPLYVPKAYIELAMIASNRGDYDKALSCLTLIVEKHPVGEDTENALAMIESIYQTRNEPEEYLAYLNRIGLSSIKDADEREEMIFNAAERIFLSRDYSRACISLTDFIDRYPDGDRALQACFYLAESLSALGRKEEAADAYLKVMSARDGAFAELATLHYADICYGLERYPEAAAAYESLLSVARLENNRHEALLGRMRAYYRDGKYISAIDAASALAATPAGARDNRIETDYISAKSMLALGRREEALPILERLSENCLLEEGAEAAYLLIQDAYDLGEFDRAETLVYSFSDSGTSHLYWLAKSFIVLGDSFAEREEWEQAMATFESIRDGYEPKDGSDDIFSQVDMRIDRLKEIMKDLQEK